MEDPDPQPESSSSPEGKQRAWPGVLLWATICAIVLFAAGVGFLNFGYGLIVATPVVAGIVLGYQIRASTVLYSLLVIVGLAAAAGVLITREIAGLYCALVAALVAAPPLLVGAAVGVLLRRRLARKKRSLRVGVLTLIFLQPWALMGIENQRPAPTTPEVVSTSRVLKANSDAAWAALIFFEDVTSKPPLLTRIGLPRALRTEGTIQQVGDEKLCIYDSGHLKKRITTLKPGRELAFDVIEQQGVEDRSARLLSGSFEFEQLADHRTRVTLTTEYLPLLAARSVWRPFERQTAHALHNHVLDAIQASLATEQGQDGA